MKHLMILLIAMCCTLVACRSSKASCDAYGYVKKIHFMKENQYLFIKKSQIPNAGLGLFTIKSIPINCIFSVFHGVVVSKNEFTQTNLNSHCIRINDDFVFDYSNHDGFAKFANDANFGSTKFTNNSVIITHNNIPKLCSTKIIYPGEEIFVEYGEEFWNGHNKMLDFNIKKIFKI